MAKYSINIPNENNFECIDLTTGKILYTASGQISGGIHYLETHLLNPSCHARSSEVVLANSYGSSPTPYLFGGSILRHGSTWNYYDPFTGALMMTIANVSASSYNL